jgi:hypothetical protein
VTKNHVESQQQSADRDACVRDVERGPMVIPGVHDNEINHVTQAHAICQVAEDAGKQQGASSQHTIVISGSLQKIVKDRDGRGNREHDEKPAAKAAAILELAKRDSRVFRVDKLEKAID